MFIYKGCYFGLYDIGKAHMIKSDYEIVLKLHKFIIANIATSIA